MQNSIGVSPCFLLLVAKGGRSCCYLGERFDRPPEAQATPVSRGTPQFQAVSSEGLLARNPRPLADVVGLGGRLAGFASGNVARRRGAGRIKVTDHLTLSDRPKVFVVGDTALVLDAKGRPVRGLAPVAKQQDRYGWPRFRAEP
jgi:hypothetical protein